MSVFFSRQCEYALQALMYMALKPDGEMTSIKELTRKINIPYHFLAKILQNLTRQGLLTSQKGPAGGFALRMAAKDITLYQIVEAIDGAEFKSNCILGFAECSGENPCAVHEKWGSLREGIYRMLVSKNIAQMAREMRKPEYKVDS